MALVKSAMALSKLNALRCAVPRPRYAVALLGSKNNCVGVIRDGAVNLLLLMVPIRQCLLSEPPRCQSKRKRPYHQVYHLWRRWPCTCDGLHRQSDACHFGIAGIRCTSCRRKLGLKRLRVQGPGREARNETSSFRVYPSSGQKSDALALMGSWVAGSWCRRQPSYRRR